jgi:hypothetical protein
LSSMSGMKPAMPPSTMSNSTVMVNRLMPRASQKIGGMMGRQARPLRRSNHWVSKIAARVKLPTLYL